MKASIVRNVDGEARSYPAFVLENIHEKGATLRGPVLLEAGEDILLRVNVKAQDVDVVASVSHVDAGNMQIVFADPKTAAALQAPKP